MTRTHTFQRLVSASIIAMLLGVVPAHAQQSSSASAQTPEGCVEQIRDELRQQRRIWHGVLYGEKRASELITGTTRYDEDGNPWIKTGSNRWRTAVEGRENEEWSDVQMDEKTEWTGMNEIEPEGIRSSRTGIFETKGAITSQLVPGIVTGYRDFECRTAMVCEAARATVSRQTTDADGNLHIETPGCEELVIKPLERCKFGTQYSKNSDQQIDLQIEETAPYTQCNALATQLVTREAAFVKISTSYDSAYRSLLQFAGAFDGFLRALKGDLLGPIENALPLLNALTRVSCFATQCNE
jgi:hypothetical protein